MARSVSSWCRREYSGGMGHDNPLGLDLISFTDGKYQQELS